MLASILGNESEKIHATENRVPQILNDLSIDQPKCHSVTMPNLCVIGLGNEYFLSGKRIGTIFTVVLPKYPIVFPEFISRAKKVKRVKK